VSSAEVTVSNVVFIGVLLWLGSGR
jgi:hypothetical protein